MQYGRFSQKQLITMEWWQLPRYAGYDAILCDGSIRSGKTLSMTAGFVMWSMTQFNGQIFAICGKTIESLRRNVILQMSHWLEGIFKVEERRSENKLIISAGEHRNSYFMFGGRDESSYMLIQGMTLAGVLFDEVALMPRSFVEQALARCSVPGSRFWFNCNPESPAHWFYLEWVQQAKKKNTLHLHFSMDDNLTLSPEVRQRYENMYSGVFYDRYILGKWVVAEGLICPEQANGQGIVPNQPRDYVQYYISCDYGTLNPCSMGLWGLCKGVWYRCDEYYYSGRDTQSQRTDEEYYAALEKLAGGRKIQAVVIDPSAASFIACIRRHGKFYVRPANNDVLNGIRRTAAAFHDGKIVVCENCSGAITEFKSYRWDDKKAEDKPIKENDHAMDDIRYFVNTILQGPTFSFE